MSKPPPADGHLLLHHETIDYRASAKRTWIVLLLTCVFMVVEIVAGWLTGSMALLADGWHMGTHAAALGISVLAYRWARSWRDDPRFAYGTGKITVLGGYTSAVVLLLVALAMGWEAVHRLMNPVPILFDQALLVAAIGLIVNVLSAVILHGGSGHHHHTHDDHDDHDHAHPDQSLRAAYLHVLADALTSALAIAALLAGRFWQWHFLDPVIGIVGGLVIAKWAFGLMRDTAPRLIDQADSTRLHDQVRERVADMPDTRIEDLHVWPCGSHAYAVILRVRTAAAAEVFHRLFQDLPCDHLTVETAAYEPSA